MKLFAALLSLLGLSLLQEALCTHLETCECHEIREMVNMTVDKAIAGLEHRLSEKMQDMIKGINTTNTQDLEKLEKRLTTTVQKLLLPIQEQLNYHLPAPNSPNHPGTSCKDIHEKNSDLPSGYYWIGESGSAVRVYCSMEETCGSETGGWMRVANIDMRNTSQKCSSGLTTLTSPKRLCDLPYNSRSRGCVSNTFTATGVSYSRVCGKIIGYQNKGPVAFNRHWDPISGSYVNGVSLTHSHPRQHIWTFAGASDESNYTGSSHKCPCITPRSTVPSYVGNHYFCDTAIHHSSARNNHIETSDPLWDGQGCTTSSCCSFNTPPWFVRDLPSPTTDDIEMRLCTYYSNGSTPIEVVELYVQ